MTQNEKDLLLKDLCARLPYGVKVQSYDLDDDMETIETLREIDSDGYVSTIECDTLKHTLKPYLFPLSSMTEEQKKDIFHNGKFYIDRHNSLCRFPRYEDDYDFVTMEDCLEIFNKLNKYHIDYKGLIPMGLALDATGLNIY